ncbi:EAL domain-containing protein [Citrobacter sp. R56]|uniref:EAL domain-containing protein n=1 Tax=Citrobacter sp. R56 TaxID=1573676 RepID=UPI001EED0764|nr:EAL domain-containing protein [Citrobacter sp. R56]
MAKSPSIQDSNFAYTAFPTNTGRALHSEFRLKLEPIVNLSSAQTFGYEVLTQLHPPGNAEHFFGELPPERLLAHFFQQLTAIAHYPQDRWYFLNLPMNALLHWDLFNLAMALYPPNVIIEIQDPETFFTLNLSQRSLLYEKVQHIEANGIPVWLDDVDESLIATFAAANWRLSGLKLDKNAFWALSASPHKLHQVVLMGYNIATAVLIEGIENHQQKEIAYRSGADLGQGYLWPALLPDRK